MRKTFSYLLIAIVLIGGFSVWRHHQQHTLPVTKQPLAPVAFNKKQYSLTDPSSIWVMVNKKRPLSPQSYAPTDLTVPKIALRLSATNTTMQVRQVTAAALQSMFAAAAKNGTPLKLSSGYRSYTYQVSLYSGYVKDQGQSDADAQSARPGYSEHQTGLAADLEPLNGACEVQQCFGSTPAGTWLAANAYEYGFIIRYPAGLQAITGYEYEPWHVRYVGIGLATEMHRKGIKTMEQFFNTGPAENY